MAAASRATRAPTHSSTRSRLAAALGTLLAVCVGLWLPCSAVAAGVACNQHEELCSRAYNSVTYISTHASFALTNQSQPTRPGTQYKSIKDQLDDGVRGLHLNIMQGATATDVSLCYPSCSVNDGGALLDTLRVVKGWLDANKNDVVTIFLEGAGTNASPSAVVKAFADSGIGKYALRGKPATWPTLGSLISDGTTLVVFVEDANVAAASAQGIFIPYPGTVLKLDGPFAGGAPWTCGPWGRTTESIMLIPHYVVQTAMYNGLVYKDMPYPFRLGVTNGYQLEYHAVTCRAGQSIWVNFMEVDFYDQGNVKTTALKLNSLPYAGDGADNFYPRFYDADDDLPQLMVSASAALRPSSRLTLAAITLLFGALRI
ncbi:hypothetical protein LPJ61_000260 [Coemansia biformis]|uniref:PLC-like phosphodiesterase n=1 Tax=Coemansia biformis TaxID=1286918 RepID=A0A9W8D0P1_9FUNG|nr:hypothetical protein LPJ61_000260 [Coemansia biformis]